MLAAADLHIHTCLSPCADDDMSPENIVMMAKLKGLDAIAICDHNSALNLPACIVAGQEHGLCVVPGIEVTSREDVHLLCYFEQLDKAIEMAGELEKKQPFIKNKPALFGNQIIMDERDHVAGTVDKLLWTACDISIDELWKMVREFGGLMVPAHINKNVNSLLVVLGMIPEHLDLPTVEIYKTEPPGVAGRLCIVSSDAHTLGNILEEGYKLECGEVTPRSILQALRQGKRTGSCGWYQS